MSAEVSPHADPPRRISIRPVLILLLILQIFTVGALIGWLSQRHGRQSVQDMANDLLVQLAAVIDEQVNFYLRVPQSLNALNNDALRLNRFDLDDFTTRYRLPWSLEHYMWQQMRLFPTPSFIYMANPRGHYVGIARHSNNELYLQFRDATTHDLYESYSLDARGRRKRLVLSERYDPRTRPWYKMAVAAKKPTWSEIYPFFDKGKIGVTAIAPMYSGAGALQAVLATDVQVAYFSTFMHGLKIGKTGRAFIMDPRGYLVGASSLEPLTRVQGPGRMALLPAEESTDPLINATARDIERRLGGFSATAPSLFHCDLNGRLLLYHVSPLQKAIGLNWTIVVTVPQEDFMEQINASTRWTVFLCLLAALLTSLIGAILTQKMIDPLKHLAYLTRDLVSHGFTAQSPAEQGIARTSHTIWEEAGQLAGSFVFMLQELQHYIIRVQEASAARERIESELRVGREIQMSVLPQDFPPFPRHKEFDLHGHIEPAKEMSGDFFDYYMIDDQHLYFTVGDVSGKGVPASLLMVTCRTLLETMANEGITDPGEILSRVNTEIARKNEALLFVTVFYAVLDVRTGELKYTNAGHNPPYMLHGEGRVEELRENPSLALGLKDPYHYRTGTLIMQPGDCFFVYTDGVTEAQDSRLDIFTAARLEKVLAEQAQAPMQELVVRVVAEVKAFVGDAPQSDDITIVAVRYRGAAQAERPKE